MKTIRRVVGSCVRQWHTLALFHGASCASRPPPAAPQVAHALRAAASEARRLSRLCLFGLFAGLWFDRLDQHITILPATILRPYIGAEACFTSSVSRRPTAAVGVVHRQDCRSLFVICDFTHRKFNTLWRVIAHPWVLRVCCWVRRLGTADATSPNPGSSKVRYN